MSSHRMMGGQKKPKITIKPFKHQVTMDPNYAENTWRLLRSAICEIHKQNASGLSFEELYRNAYNMVLHKFGDFLYRKLQQVVDEHLKAVGEQVAAADDESFLRELKRAWENHKISMLMVRDILMYMDRVYVANTGVPSVYDCGLLLFRDNIARNARIKDRLLSMLLSLVARERAGEVIDRTTFHAVTQMLVDLGVNSRAVYEDDFERPFLAATREFYRYESQQFIASNSCSDYMKKVEQRLREEMQRVAHYLDPASEFKLKDVVEDELIAQHMRTLVDMENSGLVSMLRNDKVEDLARLYTLLARVKDMGLALMRDELAKYVKACGKAIVCDADKTAAVAAAANAANNASTSTSASASASTAPTPSTTTTTASFVPALLELKDKYDRLLHHALAGDKSFQHTLNQSFEYFINLNPKSPEFISLFIDEKLKKGLKGESEEEVEATLDKVMTLFRFIQEKDVFEKYYKQHLARRLLLNRSASDDAERGMIAKLKTECGYQFTSKLEGMFTDMKSSVTTMEHFRAHLEAHPEKSLGGIDLNVQVLTTGFWPTLPGSKCNLPPQILHVCDVFKTFYLQAHTGRRLTWQTNMGAAELKAQFGAKRHELSVSTLQMCVLLLFNTARTMSFRQLREASDIAPPDLKRILAPLASPKQRILVRNAGASADEDTFTFNEAFKSKLYRVKVITVSGKDTESEASETRTKVDEDRKLQIEAAIVRIMKSRKMLEHSLLIAEVVKQLSSRFAPNATVIKKRIESLIEREYMARSRSDRKVYEYLA